MLRTITTTSALIAALALTACADKSYQRGSGVSNTGDEVLIGSVSSVDRTSLPKDGTLIVHLVKDNEVILSREEIEIGKKPVPIAYRLRYDPVDIDNDHRYYVEAMVESHEDTKWKSDRTPVLTQGGLENNVPLVVKPTP